MPCCLVHTRNMQGSIHVFHRANCHRPVHYQALLSWVSLCRDPLVEHLRAWPRLYLGMEMEINSNQHLYAVSSARICRKNSKVGLLVSVFYDLLDFSIVEIGPNPALRPRVEEGTTWFWESFWHLFWGFFGGSPQLFALKANSFALANPEGVVILVSHQHDCPNPTVVRGVKNT